MPAPWTDKPNAIIHAEVLTDRSRLVELHEFSRENPLPRWLFHPGFPPHLALRGEQSMEYYFDRGNSFVIAVDQDGMLWGYRVNRITNQRGIALHVRREADHLHEPLGDQPNGGLTVNCRESLAHMQALSWALYGGKYPLANPTENGNVAQLDFAQMYAAAEAKFDSTYGPLFGIG